MAEIEDRIRSNPGDNREQRFRTAQLRAKLGLEENPGWSNEKIALEYGTFGELVQEFRS